MAGTLLIVQIILAILIVIAVLLQKSSSIGLGAYSGSNESVFGQKGSAGFMTKLTFALALAFVINTLALGYAYNSQNSKSIVDEISIEKNIPSAGVPQGDKAVPQAPLE